MSAGIKANNDGSGAIQIGGSDYITISSAGAVAIPQTLAVTGATTLTGGVADDFKMNSGYGSVATAYGCRAWVNFNGAAAGTFAGGSSTVSRIAGSTTATITTTTAHGLITGNVVYALTGVVAGSYTVTVLTTTTFTITTVATTVLTAASITFAVNSIRASGNISSVADNGTGDYTVNFTNALPDANYSMIGTSSLPSGGSDRRVVATNLNTTPTTSAVRISVGYGVTADDQTYVNVAIFR